MVAELTTAIVAEIGTTVAAVDRPARFKVRPGPSGSHLAISLILEPQCRCGSLAYHLKMLQDGQTALYTISDTRCSSMFRYQRQYNMHGPDCTLMNDLDFIVKEWAYHDRMHFFEHCNAFFTSICLVTMVTVPILWFSAATCWVQSALGVGSGLMTLLIRQRLSDLRRQYKRLWDGHAPTP
jgi:hypothetical protein